MVSVEAIMSASSHQSRKYFHRQPLRPNVFQPSKVTTTANDPFSPLFEIAARLTHRGWCLSSMGPNLNKTSVTRWSLFGHSRPLISSDKPPIMPIDSNHRQHTTQAVIEGQLTFGLGKQWCPGADSNHRHADFQSAALPTELPGR